MTSSACCAPAVQQNLHRGTPMSTAQQKVRKGEVEKVKPEVGQKPGRLQEEKTQEKQEKARDVADALTLGLDTDDPLGVHQAIMAGLPFSSLAKFEKAAKLPRVEVAKLISTPLRSLARRKQTKRLRTGESERLVRLATVSP